MYGVTNAAKENRKYQCAIFLGTYIKKSALRYHVFRYLCLEKMIKTAEKSYRTTVLLTFNNSPNKLRNCCL